jgi:ankyrin repeat protein
MLDYLVEKKADFSATDESGRNALHYGAACTTESVLPYLLSMGSEKRDGANISAALLSKQDKEGRTVLHVVAECNSSLSFELVALEHMGIALNTKDNNGMTPMLIACSKGFTPMVLEMIRLEADTSAIDTNGKNAIWHYAFPVTESNEIELHPKFDPEIIKALLKAKCPLYSAPYRAMEHSADLYRNYSPKAPSCKEDRKKVVQGMEAADLLSIGSKLTLLTQISDIVDAENCWLLGKPFFFLSVFNIL